MLPVINPEMTPERNNLPTRWQTVIFRNYRMVPAERIAMVLECTVEDVEREAARLGLRTGEADPIWEKRGHITVIRNNWYLLPYDQLMTLIGYTEEKLDFVLAKDDFLFVKLGMAKPVCEKVTYSPLTDEELLETERLAKLIAKLDTSERKMFDFYNDPTDTEVKYVTSTQNGIRLVHPYLTPCADPFIVDSRTHLPDELLDDYAKVGVNAFVIHATLSTLSPYPLNPEESRDYKIRRKNLRELVQRAKKRGIIIDLYFNEPRAVPRDVFERYGKPELGGSTRGNLVSLCMQKEENQKMLYDLVYDLFSDIPEIGAVSCTTMSENMTHCRYQPHLAKMKNANVCPVCNELPLESNPVIVLNTINRAIRDAGSDAHVIAAMWAWTDDQIENGIPKLDKNIKIKCVSEWNVPTNIAGIPCKVVDYSISNYGPGDRAKNIIKLAGENGHTTMAKAQVSNSWEISAVPYMPLFDMELDHIKRLHDIGTTDYQLTWTLGSYPSVTFDMIADYLGAPDTFDLDKWYEKHYGAEASKVHEAVKLCCEGFRKYPFSCDVMYESAKNLGVANRWNLKPVVQKSTMVCWTFDNVEHYAKPYPPEIFISQYEKLLADFDKAIEILEGAQGTDAAKELLLFAKVARNHFMADVVHTKYVLCKKNLPASKDEMRAIIAEERALCEELIELLPQSTLIGFETANHYFYTERDVIEKLIQLDGLESELDNM